MEKSRSNTSQAFIWNDKNKGLDESVKDIYNVFLRRLNIFLRVGAHWFSVVCFQKIPQNGKEYKHWPAHRTSSKTMGL